MEQLTARDQASPKAGPRLRRSAATAMVCLLVVMLGLLPIVAPVGVARAQAQPDRSEVVLVLDFSASILIDAANRTRFADALDRIADRAQAISADLVVGDATVTILQFAATAADYPGCADLRLLGSPDTVRQLAGCLRSVAAAYRKGLDPALTAKIGIDTNYVAAMEAAARHLPQEAVRPAMILFTDGKHDVAGVPASEVLPTRDRLFGTRSPFALLPVGMGLVPSERDALERGLLDLRIIRGMPACVSGARFDWPQVVFQSPDEAGNAVAVALQDVTCTFTVAPPTASPTAPPSASPAASPGPTTPAPTTPGVDRPASPPMPSVGALNQGIAISVPSADPAAGVSSYRYECSADGGRTWPVHIDASASRPSAEIGSLANGVDYVCRARASNAAGLSDPSEPSAVVRPCGSLLECNSVVPPILGVLVLLSLVGVLASLFALYRGRTGGYVVAIVDRAHTVNLGQGSRLGIRLLRDAPGGPVTGIAGDRGRDADIRIRYRGGDRFEVRDSRTRQMTTSGQTVAAFDSQGIRHEVTLRHFATASATSMSSRA